MTLEQLDSLSEDELAMALYIVNSLSPLPSMGELPPKGLTWFRRGMLEGKIQSAFPHLMREGHPVWKSLLSKIGVEVEIKYETPTPPQLSGSVTSGSNNGK